MQTELNHIIKRHHSGFETGLTEVHDYIYLTEDEEKQHCIARRKSSLQIRKKLITYFLMGYSVHNPKEQILLTKTNTSLKKVTTVTKLSSGLGCKTGLESLNGSNISLESLRQDRIINACGK